jgi:hypothetical protein
LRRNSRPSLEAALSGAAGVERGGGDVTTDGCGGMTDGAGAGPRGADAGVLAAARLMTPVSSTHASSSVPKSILF